VGSSRITFVSSVTMPVSGAAGTRARLVDPLFVVRVSLNDFVSSSCTTSTEPPEWLTV
jgi:hypothetical protein